MSTFLQYFKAVLYWGIVPLTMFSLIVIGANIALRLRISEKRISAGTGWLAGLVLFVFVFIYHLSSISVPRITLHTTITLSIPAGIVGAIIAFLVLLLLKPLIKKRMTGILTLLLSFSGSTSLFSYFFIRNINHLLLSGTLGLAFGTLVHFVIFPENARDLFTE